MKLKNLKGNKLARIFQYSLIKYLALAFAFLKGLINAKFLGPELLGVLGNLTLILGYTSYANLGIIYSMNREYVLEEEKSIDKGERVLNTTFTSLFIISIVFIILSILSILIYRNTFGIYLALIFIIAIFEQFKNYFTNYFRLIDNYNMINLVEVIYNIISFILTFILINDFKIYGVLISMLICGIIILILGIVKSRNIKLKIEKRILKSLISIGIPLLIYNLGFYILTTIDRWIIIKYFTDADLGYYTFANNMVSATLVFITSMLFLIYPKLIKNFNEGKNRNILIIVNRYTRLLEIACAIFFTMGVVIFKPFIDIFLDKYVGSIEIYMILLLSVIVNTLSYFANCYIVSNRKQKYLVYLQVMSILVNLTCNIIFVKLGFGVKGVALGTLITNAIYSIMQYNIFIKLTKGKSNVARVIRLYRRILLYSILMSVMMMTGVSYIIYSISTILLTIVLYIGEIKNIKSYIDLIKNII